MILVLKALLSDVWRTYCQVRGKQRDHIGGCCHSQVEILDYAKIIIACKWSDSSYVFFCFFLFSAAPCGVRDLSSPNRDRTCAPFSGHAVS